MMTLHGSVRDSNSASTALYKPAAMR